MLETKKEIDVFDISVYQELYSIFLKRDSLWIEFMDLFLQHTTNVSGSISEEIRKENIYRKLGFSSIENWFEAPVSEMGFGSSYSMYKKMSQAYEISKKHNWIRYAGYSYTHIILIRSMVLKVAKFDEKTAFPSNEREASGFSSAHGKNSIQGRYETTKLRLEYHREKLKLLNFPIDQQLAASDIENLEKVLSRLE